MIFLSFTSLQATTSKQARYHYIGQLIPQIYSYQLPSHHAIRWLSRKPVES